MGLCTSSSAHENVLSAAPIIPHLSASSGEQIRAAATRKIVLLGAAETGKSTILKQMKILFGKGISLEVLSSAKNVIADNILWGMQSVCEAAEKLGPYKDNISARRAFDRVKRADFSENDLTPSLAASISKLWADPVFQQVWARRSEFQTFQALSTFVARVKEVSERDYVPTVEEFMLSYVRTGGIIAHTCIIGCEPVLVFDTGGLRSLRKDLNRHEGMDAVIFVSALSAYDQTLSEDRNSNRMVEDLNLFQLVCNSRHFMQSDMILFLNKRDLFQEKIQQVDIKSVAPFSDYSGTPHSYEEGMAYFAKKFLQTNMNPTKEVFVHPTCAIDINSLQRTFGRLNDILLKQKFARDLSLSL